MRGCRSSLVVSSGLVLLLVVAPWWDAGVQASLVFESPIYPVEPHSYPFRIDSADFNGDGTMDLATWNYEAGNFSILLGLGGGEMTPPVSTGPGTGPFDTGDLDGDGKADLAYASFGTDQICVLMSLGGGAFSAPRCFTTGDGPYSVLARDLDADGRTDVVSANYYSGDVSFFRGNGDGTFQTESRFAAGAGPIALAAGRFNGDEHMDLAVADSDSDEISILFGEGDGSFGPPAGYPCTDGPFALAAGDADGDGRDDLAVGLDGSLTYGTTVFLHNAGDGSFGAPAVMHNSYGTTLDLAFVDVDVDGALDLVMTQYALVFARGHGDGTFDPQVDVGGSGSATSVAVADFTGDGVADFAFAGSYRDTVGILFGNGRGTTGQRHAVGAFPRAIVHTDFDHDGLADLATANEDSFDVSVLRALPGGGFAPQMRQAVGFFPVSLAAADLNSDGTADLLAKTYYPDAISTLIGRGDGTFDRGPREPLPSTFTEVHVADVNGDGQEDLILMDYPDTITVRLSNGDLTFGPDIVTRGTPTGFMLLAASLDGDGTIDLAVGRYTGSVGILLGNGDGTFRPGDEVDTIGSLTYSIRNADLNGDGRTDLIVATDEGLTTAPGNGDGTFGSPEDHWVPDGTFFSVVADFDLDGDLDLATGTVQGLLFWKNDGGALVQDGIYDAGVGIYDALTADFDGDGKPDVAGGDAYSDAVVVLRNILDRAPIAEVGADRLVECGTAVVLDGGASTDADSATGTNDDIVGFEWFEDFGLPSQRPLGEGQTLEVALPLGVHAVTLRVTDRRRLSDTDEALVTVIDGAPPVGSITSPAPGSCHGVADLPVVVEDNFTDACSTSLARVWEPPGNAGAGAYSSHGDHEVSLTATDGSGNSAGASVGFTIDLDAPLVRLLPPPTLPGVAASEIPFSRGFASSDDDGASGEVVHEVLFWNGCPVFDGATWGDRDGLLGDESLTLDRGLLCAAYRTCGRTSWRDPVLRVEATDCGGNVGSDERIVPGEFLLRPDACGREAGSAP